jgi:hypothetical protein
MGRSPKNTYFSATTDGILRAPFRRRGQIRSINGGRKARDAAALALGTAALGDSGQDNDRL